MSAISTERAREHGARWAAVHWSEFGRARPRTRDTATAPGLPPKALPRAFGVLGRVLEELPGAHGQLPEGARL